MNGQTLAGPQSVLLAPGEGGIAVSATENSVFLLLSGAPINEPVAQHGPFVMNTKGEFRAVIAITIRGVSGV